MMDCNGNASTHIVINGVRYVREVTCGTRVDRGRIYTSVSCDVCGNKLVFVDTDEYDIGNYRLPNFCKDCGARVVV